MPAASTFLRSLFASRAARRPIAGRLALASVVGVLVLQIALTGLASAAITAGSASLAMSKPAKGDAALVLNIAKPAGVVDGTLLLAQITFEKGRDAGTDAQLTPAGWSLIRRTNGQTHPSGTDIG